MRTLGCDPEVFLTKNGEVHGAIGYVPGTKKEPFKTPYGAIQLDNVCAEFNIAPATTEEEWVFNIKHTMQELESIVAKHGFKLLTIPEHVFDIGYILDNPEALEMGCDAAYDAFNRGAAVRVCDPYDPFRSAGGHIHIGEKLTEPKVHIAVATLSNVLLPELHKLYNDRTRQQGYGHPGSFRMKPYGFEWRAPSNVWLRSEDTMRWMYRSVNKVMDFLQAHDFDSLSFYSTRDIQIEAL